MPRNAVSESNPVGVLAGSQASKQAGSPRHGHPSSNPISHNPYPITIFRAQSQVSICPNPNPTPITMLPHVLPASRHPYHTNHAMPCHAISINPSSKRANKMTAERPDDIRGSPTLRTSQITPKRHAVSLMLSKMPFFFCRPTP